jgi:uncharacterized protein (TIGR02145 family)
LIKILCITKFFVIFVILIRINMKKLLIPFVFLLLAACSKDVVRYHGHQYKTIQAKTQIWMAENLQTNRYRLGKKIPLINDTFVWPELKSAACGFMNSDTARLRKYGMYYNWEAVDGGKLCPFAWRVPTNTDWDMLEEYLGGEYRAGGKMKSVKGWMRGHVSGDDIGFNGLPGGGYCMVDLGNCTDES